MRLVYGSLGRARTPALWLLAIVCLVGAGTLVAAPAGQPSAPESLDSWLEGIRKEHQLPALGAIVLRADSVVAHGVAGLRRSDQTTPVAIRDRFQLGSNTKAMTATVIATLVEEGKLTWTTTLADALPDLRDSMDPGFRAATIDLLLSHHADVSPFTDMADKDFKSIPRIKGAPEKQRAAFAAWVLRGKPAGPIGGEGMYSNGGYAIAGAIAERVTGKSWEALLRERVFQPLGIEATFAWSESADLEQPWGHFETRRGLKPVSPRDVDAGVPPIFFPAGAVEISLDDYARFLQVHLQGLEGHDTKILRAATIRHLHASPVAPADKFALGWGVQDIDGVPSSVHVGSAGAFLALTILQPARDLGVAVFTNDGGERATATTRDVAKTLLHRFAAVEAK